MALTKFRIDEQPHAMDGLRLLAQEGTREVEAFVSRKVMDVCGRIDRAQWRTSEFVPEAIQRAWETELCRA